MTYKSNTREALNAIDKQTGTLLIACAISVQSQAKRDFSTSYPPASKPGEFPHGRTWNLRESIMYDPDDPVKVGREGQVRIGYSTRAPYGAILELFKKRMGINAVVKGLRKVINQVIARIPKL